jgi:methyl coenzyme M reductase beta subunit
MAIIPLPERGQPLDLAYVYSLANAVNDLSAQISPASSKTTTVDTIIGKQTLRTADTKVIGGIKRVTNNSIVTAGNESTFSYDFPADFKYAPIVTATVVNVGDTPAGKDVSVVLTSITTSRIEGLVRFGTSGEVSVSVNIIAIGVPN